MRKTNLLKDHTRKRKKFLSLFWKGFIFLSLLIITISGSFAILNYFYLAHQFRDQRSIEEALLTRQLHDLLSRSATRLQQLGSVLASVSDFGTAFRKNNPLFLHPTASIYSDFQYNLDIERLELFSPNGLLFWQWGLTPSQQADITKKQAAVRTVIQREEPANLLLCDPQCSLHVYQPVLADGRLAGVFSLSQSIADLVIEYQSLTGSDLGLLVPMDQPGKGQSLPNWRLNIAALTHAERLAPFLHHLAQHYALDAPALNDEIQKWKGRYYSIHRVSLNAMVQAGGTALIVTDVTEQSEHINNATRDGIILALAGLFTAELLLLLFMRFPVRQLRRLAAALPLLAQGSYVAARSQLMATKKSYRLRDEVLILDEAALKLSQQLESQALAIEQKREELAAERDFVQGLLDTAQVMILTQSSSGKILTANALTLQLTGFEQHELRGRHFRSLILETRVSDSYEESLDDLWEGRRKRLQHEAELLCKDGARRNVVWVHSRLHEHNPADVAILSVGLDVTERVEAETRYMWLANHDPLTGLYNRRGFQDELERIYSEVERNQMRAALILFDLDHFKDINDTSGHLAGDELLSKIATELKSRIRRADVVARLGGDEFAVLMPNQTHEGALAFANLLNKRLRALPVTIQQKMFQITASIGVAMIPEHGGNIDEVMANADLAMYQAKNSGRGCTHSFSYDDHARQRISDRTHWKQTIQQALLDRRLIFHYQPIVSVKTRRVTYLEALVRLKDTDGRLVPPGDFLEYAQLTGLIRDIDRYVVEEAIQFLHRHEEYKTLGAIHINLSASALSNREWTEPLKAAIKNQEIQPDRLIFEITETAAIADFGTAKEIMEELARIGFRFAIDDFGVGFASFAYLRHLPVQFVKIDQSYITHITDNPRDHAFVSAITTLAHGNNIEVIAEGVEEQGTLELLNELGVDLAQGYLISRPKPIEEIVQSLSAKHPPVLKVLG